ncbi:FkbM family methyltransferase [Streptomyces sp. URMC 126]|uniref:FkbM family methyltransferase n=1 Tax=Streptomyces sp. URMC 126 TaxID=3423401 RepID=UPI003F19A559
MILVTRGAAQLEVDVVERSGDLLLATGSPYVEAPADLEDYNPYLPGMAVLGLPHALFGDTPLADARWWFGAVFLASMAASAQVMNRQKHPRMRGPLLLLAACPAVALPMSVGGVDLPVIGLMCLGLALAGSGASHRAGMAIGAAAALKWTAWPLLPVAVALLAATRGKRHAVRSVIMAGAVLILAVLPVALAHPHSFLEHLVLFPLGEGGTPTPAASPLPGHLLAALIPSGTALAVAALAAAALAVGISLLVRPPMHTLAAADRLALGLVAAMCLAPATRFGYLVYPIVLAGWVRLVLPRPVTAGESMRSLSLHSTAPQTVRVNKRRLAWSYAALRALGRRFSFVEREIDGLQQVVREGDVCLDIGAEYGLYTYALAHLVGPKGAVHSFEPLPGAYRVLTAGTRLLGCPNVHRHPFALGRQAQDSVMSLPYRYGLPVHGRAFVTDGAHGIGPNVEFAGERRLKVRVRTVDDLYRDGTLDRVDFIKADVEGAEPLVLAGAKETLLRDRPSLLLEVEARHLAKFGVRAADLAASLHGLGYEMSTWRQGRWRPMARILPECRNYLFTARPLGG